jgi:hypothetical protein
LFRERPRAISLEVAATMERLGTGADTGQNRLQKLNEGRLVSRMRESGLRGIFKETQRFWF